MSLKELPVVTLACRKMTVFRAKIFKDIYIHSQPRFGARACVVNQACARSSPFHKTGMPLEAQT